MALRYDHGAVQWLAADTATTTYVVNTMTFQPKALRFWWVGIGSATDAASEAVSSRRGMGFATGTSARRCVASFSQDTADPSNCGTSASDDCIAATTDGAAAIDGKLDLTALAGDGFTLTVDDQVPVDITIFWEAWGGTDITVAVVGNFASPGGSGTQNYTATGFVGGATDQVVFFAGVQSTAAVNSAAAEASGFCIGAAASTTAGDNICVGGNADDASATMDTDGWGLDGRCVCMIPLAGSSAMDLRGTVSAWGTDLFTVNYAESSVANRRFVFLAIKGGVWKSGSFVIDVGTQDATATISGLTTPVVQGVNLMVRGGAETADDAASGTDLVNIGCGTSTSSRRAMGIRDEDATGTCEIDTVIEYDQVLAIPGTTGNLVAAYDISAVNSDGFTLIVDTPSGAPGQSIWGGYVMWGNLPTTAALTGTITASVTEADIVAGGKTLIITLTNNTWIAAGAGSFDLQRDEIIAGVDSAQSETLGWDLVPKATQSLGGVVRTSDTVVTITWDAFATYDITATETITVTVPATALVDVTPNIVASPTFNITHLAAGRVMSSLVAAGGLVAHGGLCGVGGGLAG